MHFIRAIVIVFHFSLTPLVHSSIRQVPVGFDVVSQQSGNDRKKHLCRNNRHSQSSRLCVHGQSDELIRIGNNDLGIPFCSEQNK